MKMPDDDLLDQILTSLLLLAGLGGYVFIKRRKTAKPALAPIAA
jgi:LPXTG-motif cell wall-anchored protein